MIIFLIIVFGAYASLIVTFILGFKRVSAFEISDTEPTTSFSVIIPFRNEVENLPSLLEHLKELRYPKSLYTVHLINDASTDGSRDFVTDFLSKHKLSNYHCSDNERVSDSPKKDAILTAIKNSTNEWIVTTDADCTFSKDWLRTLDHFIQDKHPKMVVAPVSIALTKKPSFINAFEQLDFLSLMGITRGAFGIKKPFLCNGANLAYERQAFFEVDGFASNDHIASGDDHFLMEKFVVRFRENVTYLNATSSIVTTQPQKNLKGFISQRIRWAAKGTGYSYWFSTFVGLLAFLANLATALFLVFLTVGSIYTIFAKASPIVDSWIGYTLLMASLKFLVDFIIIFCSASYYNRRRYLGWYPLVMLCYPILTSFIALRALTTSFTWKGRSYKQ